MDNKLHEIGEHIKLLKQKTIENIIEIGNNLMCAKGYCKHGEWLNFLENNVKINERTAQNFMKVAKEYSTNTYLNSDLNQSQIFKLLGIEKEKRQNFIETEHNVNGKLKKVKDMTSTELSKAIKQYKDLEDKLDSKKVEIKDIKETIYKATKLDNASVEFEEVITDSGLAHSLFYNIYLVTKDSKELIAKELYSFYFTGEYNSLNVEDVIKENKILLPEEKDFIIGECLKFKTNVQIRETELKKIDAERINNTIKNFNNNINNIENKTVLKKFYITLAKEFHPDKGGSDEEMQILNKLKIQWGI